MDRGLEEWLRGDTRPLYPEDMGLPVVREFARRRFPGFRDLSVVEFLGGPAAAHEPLQEVPAVVLDAPDPADFTAPTEEIIPHTEEKSDGPEEIEPLLNDGIPESQPEETPEPERRMLEDEVLFGPLDLPDAKPRSRTSKKTGLVGAALVLAAVAGGSVFFMKGDTPEKTMEKARILFESGDFTGAVELYGKIDEDVPLPVSHLIRRGEAYFSAGRTAEALNSYYEALSVVPESADIYKKIGATFLILGSPLQAEKAYTEAVRLSPDRGSLAELAELKMKRGDLEGALLVLEGPRVPVLNDSLDELKQEIKAQLAPPVMETPVVSRDFLAVSMDEIPDPSADVAAVSSDVFVSPEVLEVPVIPVSCDSEGLDLPEALVAEKPPVAEEPLAAEELPAPRETAAAHKNEPPEKTPLPGPRVATRPRSFPTPADDEGRFRQVLISGREISHEDGPALKRLAGAPTSDRSLYSLGQMYNRGGRPRDALLFLEKGLAVDGDNRWLLAETAYSYGSIGRDDDAMAMVRHALVRGKRTFAGVSPPSAMVAFPSSVVWDIGWDRRGTVADKIPLYDAKPEDSIPGLAGPKLDFGRYLPLQNAIARNPMDRSLYVDFMVLWPRADGYSAGSLAAGALAVESHSLLMAGDLQGAKETMDKAINVAPHQPLLVEMKKNLF